MSQITLSGKIVAAQPFFDNGTFRKQTLIIEVVNGNYTSYFPIDFTQANIDNVMPQCQMGGTYNFTGYVQGSKNQMQDRNGQPTAYLSISVTAVAPAQASAPAPAQNNFQQPQQQAQGFAQQAPAQQGFAGQPQQATQQQGFGAPAQQAAPPQQTPFGQPAQNTAQGFGQNQAQPQPAAAQPFGTPPANNGAFGNL